MFQMPLIDFGGTDTRTIAVEGIRASVMQNDQGKYEVLLEINSNKMLIAMQGALDYIEQFEIIAVRGFIELSTSFIQTIKKLVGHLLCRLD
ncbi:MAG: hypothetical protein HG439_003600 [candidate division SR1 bacterium]|nr:hypothetical protein [candidate division SR1 bacterium]RKW23232.1 MAG: hypothetical protein D8B45_03740 [Candidatus Gracilibacteria bacterium]